jgi:hypothetical protein
LNLTAAPFSRVIRLLTLQVSHGSFQQADFGASSVR